MSSVATDYIARCVPNAYVMRGFEVWHYATVKVQGYEADATETESIADDAELQQQRLEVTSLQELQAVLMRHDYLACVDRGERQLWIFSRIADRIENILSNDTEGPLSVSNIRVRVHQRAQFVTAELLKDAQSATMQVLKTAQPHQASVGTRENLKSEEIAARHFRLLITAIVETLSYKICSSGRAFVPVAFGTLAGTTGYEEGVNTQDHNPSSATTASQPFNSPVQLLRIVPVLTVHGSLIVSFCKSISPPLERIDSSPQHRVICIGPIGSWAYQDGVDEAVSGKNQAPPNDAFGIKEITIWRENVRAYLLRRGYSAPPSQSAADWLQIKLSKSSKTSLSWPAALCFAWKTNRLDDRSQLAWRDWFVSSVSKDSLNDALKWLWSEDVASYESINTSLDPEDGINLGSDLGFTSTSFVASPASTRPAFYQDINSSTIYPTPPDGLPTAHPSDPIQETHDDTSQMRDSGLTASEADIMDFDIENDGPNITNSNMAADISYADDLFGDEAGLSEAQEVTDADFDFFDGVGLDLETTELNLTQPSTTAVSLEDTDLTDRKSSHASQDLRGDFSAAVTPNPSGQKHVAFAVSSEESPSRFEQTISSTVTAEAPERDGLDFNTGSDLTPSRVKQGLVDLNGAQQVPRFNKHFGAVNFNVTVQQSDTKYTGKGRFAKIHDVGRNSKPSSPFQVSFSENRSAPWSRQTGNKSMSDKHRLARSESSTSNDSCTQQSADEAESTSEHPTSPLLGTGYATDGLDLATKIDSSSKSHARHTINPGGADQNEANLRSNMILCDYFNGYKSSIQNGPPASMISREHSQTRPVTTRDYGSNIMTQRLSEIAQTVANCAAVSPYFDHRAELYLDENDTQSAKPNILFPSQPQMLTSIVDGLFGERVPVDDLISYAVADPMPILPSPKLGAPSPGRIQYPLVGEAIFEIPAPEIRIRRGGSDWCIEPSAMAFWDVLGIEPAYGDKPVVSHCIVPGTEALLKAAVEFLHSAKAGYENAKLGQHSIGGLLSEFQNGIIPTDASRVSDESTALQRLEDTCLLLASVLGQRAFGTETLVVYIIDPFENTGNSLGLCRCCTTLRIKYQEILGTTGDSSRPKIVPVIVPIELLAARGAPKFPAPREMAVLARHVYDIIPQSSLERDMAISTAPILELEPQFRTRIPFELSERSSADPQLEGCCMHLAYMTSADGKWVVSAWTDNTGKYQHTSAYSLEARSFAEVAYELWLTTIDIIRARKVCWRLFVTSGSPMSIQEQRLWLRLATMLGSVQAPVRATLTLLSVNVAPAFELSSVPASSEATFSGQSAGGPLSHVTPTSTPGPLGASPNPTPPTGFNAATPSSEAVAPVGEADANSRLSDTSDDSWGIILSHTLCPLGDPTIYAPARVSGYLAKRQTPHDRGSPVLFEVNLLHCADKIEPGESALIRNDKALRDALIAFRGLSVLARLKNLEPHSSTIPWHVAAARRGAEALTHGLTV